MKQHRLKPSAKCTPRLMLGLALGGLLLASQPSQAALILSEDFGDKPGGVMTVNSNNDNVGQYSFPTITGTFYISALIRFEGTVNRNDFGGIYFNTASQGLGIGIKGDGNSTTQTEDLFARLSVGDAAYGQDVTPGDTYQIVAKFTRNGSGYDTVTLWVNPDDASSPSTTVSIVPVVNINPNVLKFRGANLDDGDAVIFDRLRIGTDFVDVVPEPSTYVAGALLLLPFGASALRRFRRA